MELSGCCAARGVYWIDTPACVEQEAAGRRTLAVVEPVAGFKRWTRGAGSTGVGGSGAMIGQTLPGSEQTSALCHCATRVKLFYGCTSYTRRARIGCIDLLTPGAPRSHTRTDEGSLGRASCALITVIWAPISRWRCSWLPTALDRVGSKSNEEEEWWRLHHVRRRAGTLGRGQRERVGSSGLNRNGQEWRGWWWFLRSLFSPFQFFGQKSYREETIWFTVLSFLCRIVSYLTNVILDLVQQMFHLIKPFRRKLSKAMISSPSIGTREGLKNGWKYDRWWAVCSIKNMKGNIIHVNSVILLCYHKTKERTVGGMRSF